MQQPDVLLHTGPSRPRVLLVYYSYTQQTRKVAQEMADVFGERGYEVHEASIGFKDPRWAERFSSIPFRHLYRDLFGMIPAQLRSATGEITIPDDAQAGNYDLVVIGSPTWWMKTSVPIRSYLQSSSAAQILDGTPFACFVVCRRYWSINLKAVKKLSTANGGVYIDGSHWTFAGGQIKSLLSLLSYLGTGQQRDRYLGAKIPPTNLNAGDLAQARAFAARLADQTSSP